MPVVISGTQNTAAQILPQLTITLVPPAAAVISGTSTDVVGVVGTGSWGPKNTPAIVSGPSDCTVAFGPMTTRKFDLGTQVFVANLQGATNFRAIRVTDGTDTAASATVAATELAKAPAFYAGLAAALNQGVGVLRGASARVTLNAATGVLAALYTGSVGNGIAVSITAGSKPGTARAVVGLSGGTPEVYDNLPATGGMPTAEILTLIGGTDGAAGVTAATLVGTDVSPRSGMYALRRQGVRHLLLADADDSTQWTIVDAFGVEESCYTHQVAPAGSSIAAVIAEKQAVGLDSAWTSLMHGDWLYVSDPVNSVTRLVSPAAFKAGKLAAQSPEQSRAFSDQYALYPAASK